MRTLFARTLARSLAAVAAVAAAAVLGASASAADLPSGTVESIEQSGGATVVVLHFDAQAAAKLLPGGMVALYAAGTVEKHPLTGQVLVARPVLVAKVQLTSVVGRLAGTVRWTADGAKLASGMDAIPLPSETAPNGPPALTAQVVPLRVASGALVQLQLPVADPDQDALITRWRLDGPRGHSGRLVARTNGGVTTGWLAPVGAGETTAIATVRDTVGQELEVRVPLSVVGDDKDQTHAAKPFAQWGSGLEPALQGLARDTTGTWWGLAASGLPVRIAAGWQTWELLALPQEQQPKRGVALAVRGDELHVLDAGRKAVVVYGTDSTVRRTYGSFDHPTSLALAADGTAFVADQSAGGIEVIEPDGSYRGRLGRSGVAAGAWANLVAVTLDRAGELYALDQGRHSVTHYDRFQRRIEEWAIPSDPKDYPLDLAVHPTRGVLVLYSSGRLVAAKQAVEVAAPNAALGIDLGPARALAIDQLGEVVTCHTQNSALVRFDADLVCVGERAEQSRAQELWAADGSGASHGLDPDSGAVTSCDGEGWVVARHDSPARGGGLFGSTLALAAAPVGNRLWIVDSKKHGVHRLDLDITATPGFIGGEGANNGQFDEPIAAACDEAGRLYVLDASAYRVQVFDAQGAFLFTFGQKGKGQGELRDPLRIAVAPAGDAAYIYDAYTNELKKFALDQAQKTAHHVTNGGGKGSDPGQLKKVVGLACDRRGLLFALDASREDVQVLDFRGNSCVLVNGARFSDLGVAKATALVVSPDGLVGLIGGGRVGWLRW